LYQWGESLKGLIKSPFLAINAKGGEILSPKQKDRTTTLWIFLIDIFQIGMFTFNWYMYSKLASQYISNWYLLKPSWKLRREFYSGGVLFSQRKSIWNRGRKFQILKMLLAILFLYLWLFAKGFWKYFPKEFAKTKQVVQAWSKMLNKRKQSMHI
jgi:hypothetical protein